MSLYHQALVCVYDELYAFIKIIRFQALCPFTLLGHFLSPDSLSLLMSLWYEECHASCRSSVSLSEVV
jgi:hypothetical protein